jgi:hypothetical protein
MLAGAVVTVETELKILLTASSAAFFSASIDGNLL